MGFIEELSDKEWEDLIDKAVGERAEDYNPQPDPRFTERHDGPTPSGGDYTIAYYYDAEHAPCEKSKAKYCNIIEYNKEGHRLNEVYGKLD